jgi:hypothetical protein
LARVQNSTAASNKAWRGVHAVTMLSFPGKSLIFMNKMLPKILAFPADQGKREPWLQAAAAFPHSYPHEKLAQSGSV